jgi:hypothetical protein
LFAIGWAWEWWAVAALGVVMVVVVGGGGLDNGVVMVVGVK